MKIGIVGLGYWGKHYVRIVNKVLSSQLIAICDERKDVLENYKYLNVELYTNVSTMIKSGTIDSIIIVVNASVHKKIIIEALKHNLSIFVEKPYTLNMDDCIEIEKFVNKDTKIMIGHTYLYNNKIHYIKQLLESHFKNVKTVEFVWSGSGYHPNDTTPVFDLSVHPLSIILYLFPNGEIENVSSLSSVSHNTYFIQFTKNKILFRMNISWSSPGKTRNMIINDDNVKLIFDDVSNTSPIKIFYTDYNKTNFTDNTNSIIHSDGTIVIPPIEADEPLTSQFISWIDYCEQNADIISNHTFGKKIVELCEKLNR
jgi:predicted dehydrogenase